MAHFAKIENGKVVRVIAISNDELNDLDFPESEQVGLDFIAGLGFIGDWKQTSYNKNFRGQFAGVGKFYDEAKDCFHGGQPFDSWSLNNQGQWIAPVPKPDNGYKWDENGQQWVAP